MATEMTRLMNEQLTRAQQDMSRALDELGQATSEAKVKGDTIDVKHPSGVSKILEQMGADLIKLRAQSDKAATWHGPTAARLEKTETLANEVKTELAKVALAARPPARHALCLQGSAYEQWGVERQVIE